MNCSKCGKTLNSNNKKGRCSPKCKTVIVVDSGGAVKMEPGKPETAMPVGPIVQAKIVARKLGEPDAMVAVATGTAPKSRRKGEPPEMPDLQKVPRTQEQWRNALAMNVRCVYDFQRVRIAAGGRPRAFDGNDERPEAQTQLSNADLNAWSLREVQFEKLETDRLKDVEDILKSYPLYNDLRANPKYKGMGVRLWGVIFSEFDIRKADTVSKMWSFAGLIPIPCMRCKTCKSELSPTKGAKTYTHPKHGWTSGTNKHEDSTDEGRPFVPGEKPEKDSVDDCPNRGMEMTDAQIFKSDRAQRPEKGVKNPYNAWLRAKMLGVLGDCLIKAQGGATERRGYFGEMYYGYKARLAAMADAGLDGGGKNDAHRHRMAIRWMVKMVLLNIHRDWRTFEGLTVRPEYRVEYLHKQPHTVNEKWEDRDIKTKGKDVFLKEQQPDK